MECEKEITSLEPFSYWCLDVQFECFVVIGWIMLSAVSIVGVGGETKLFFKFFLNQSFSFRNKKNICFSNLALRLYVLCINENTCVDV